MTYREFYNAVVMNISVPEDVRQFASEKLRKMDAERSSAAEECQPFVDQVVGCLTGEYRTTSAIAAEAGLSVPKASAMLRKAVAANRAEVTDVKVKGKGTQKAYRIKGMVDYDNAVDVILP